jgi:hypothetical protein
MLFGGNSSGAAAPTFFAVAALSHSCSALAATDATAEPLVSRGRSAPLLLVVLRVNWLGTPHLTLLVAAATAGALILWQPICRPYRTLVAWQNHPQVSAHMSLSATAPLLLRTSFKFLMALGSVLSRAL